MNSRCNRVAKLTYALAALSAMACGGEGESGSDFDPTIYLNEFSCTPSNHARLDTNCSSPVASIPDLDMTPRCAPRMSEGHREYADADRLEALAALVSEAAAADPVVYGRIVRDVLAIRELQPDLTQVLGYRPDIQGVGLNVDLETFNEMEAGEYHAWDCLNTLFKAFEPNLWRSSLNPEIVSVSISFEGIYDFKILAEEYALLKGVSGTYWDGLVGDRADTCVSVLSDEWQYIFDAASGDCPSGCIDHVYYRFTVDAAGRVASAGQYDNSSDEEAPAWLRDAHSAGECY